MKRIAGIAASNGIAMAKVYHLIEPDLTYGQTNTDNPDYEINRLNDALHVTKEDLQAIRAHTENKLGTEHAEIFSAHLLVLEDPEFINQIKDKITQGELTAEAALDEVSEFFMNLFENMDNEYMRERAADIKDVTKRVMAHLLGVTLPNPALINEEVIVVAHDLTPSHTAQLNRKYVKGFATNIGEIGRAHV